MGYPQGGPPQGYQPQPQPQQPAAASFDIQKILANFTTGELVIGGASILWIIFSFFGSWLSYSYSCPSNVSSFGVSCSSLGGSADIGATIYHGWGWLAFIAWLGIVAFFVLRKFLGGQVQLPALPVPDAYVYMGLGGVQILASLLYWLEYKQSASDSGFSASISFGWVWFVGVILSIGVIVGGYLKMQDPAPVAAGPTPGGGYGAYAGYQQPPAAPPAYPQQPAPPAYPQQPQAPYGDPSQQQGYPPQQPPGYPPQQ
jgi:hypothetical protein